MNNEYTMEHINRLAIGNLARMYEDIEDRVSYLEAQYEKTRTAAADEQCGSPLPANGFDLAAYKTKLEQRLRECETQYPTYTIDIMQSRVAGQIDAYKHALRLLDA